MIQQKHIKKNKTNNEEKKIDLKVLLILLVITIVFLILGSIITSTIKRKFTNDFIHSKITFAKYIAKTIDSNDHRYLNEKKSIADEKFKYYHQLLNSILNNDSDIQYLYTLSYDQQNDNITYTIDGGTVEYDTVRIESNLFAFELIVKNSKAELSYNGYESDEFHVEKDNYSVKVTIDNNSLKINDTKLFDILSAEPLILKPNGISWTIEDNKLSEAIPVVTNKGNVDFFLSFTAKGQPSSNPGTTYVDDTSVIENIKNVITNSTDMISYTNGSYGEVISVYAPILNTDEQSNALVGIDYNQDKIEQKTESITQPVKTYLFLLYLIFISGFFFISGGKKYLDQLLNSFIQTKL